ncbi:hypothetical protein HOD08_02680 [bacterium]|jgi:hypothetical protein|nr:hypothetical protein [bacterium]
MKKILLLGLCTAALCLNCRGTEAEPDAVSKSSWVGLSTESEQLANWILQMVRDKRAIDKEGAETKVSTKVRMDSWNKKVEQVPGSSNVIKEVEAKINKLVSEGMTQGAAEVKAIKEIVTDPRTSKK